MKTLGELVNKKKVKFLTTKKLIHIEFICPHCGGRWYMDKFPDDGRLYCPKCGKSQYVECSQK